MLLDLLSTTAGKQDQQSAIGGDTQRASRFAAGRHPCRAIEHRMADEHRVDAVLAEQIFLELEDHSRLRDRRRQTLHPAGTRGPHLGRDIVQDRHLRGLRRAGDVQVESAVVHQHHQRHPPRIQPRANVVQKQPMLRQLLEDPREAHDGERADVLDERDSRVSHLIAADADEVERRFLRFQLARHTRGIGIAGRLTRDQQDLTHAPERPTASAGPGVLVRSRGRFRARPPAPRAPPIR